MPALLIRAAQRWFFGGLIAAVVLGYQVDNLFGSDPSDYRAFPSSTVPAQQPWQLAVALLLITALLAAMWCRRGERVESELSSTSVMFGAAIAISAGLVARVWSESGWLAAAALVLVAATFAAGRRWLLPEQAMALAAAMAGAAILVVEPGLDVEPSMVTLVVGSAAAVGGAVYGLRFRRPALAVAVCAVAALLATLSHVSETGWVRVVAGAVLLFAIAMTGFSCLPIEPALLAGWSVLPALASLTSRELTVRTDTESAAAVNRWTSDYYPTWAAYVPGRLTGELVVIDAPQQTFVSRPAMIIPGLILTGLCAACAVGLARHGADASRDRNASQPAEESGSD
ncbi:hypothetical protein ACFO5K_09250 [Nocardia halotolerans]|uniref:Uncharacterized protein n=1 Tax=Nocardia halotolerans TaxID=1755878 RepID=A0ABV8VFA9_9NOCA